MVGAVDVHAAEPRWVQEYWIWGRDMEDGLRFHFRKDTCHVVENGNVALVVCNARHVVSFRMQINDMDLTAGILGKNAFDQVGANESTTACDKHGTERRVGCKARHRADVVAS